jgi:membrane protease YdiL (CAAX protease family)
MKSTNNKTISSYLSSIDIKFISFKILLIVGIGLILTYLLNTIGLGSYLEEGVDEEELHIIVLFILGVILIPIVETFLYQHLFIKLLRSMGIKNNIPIFILCGILFSVMHFYNYVYALTKFPAGYILGYSYVKLEEQDKAPFINTYLIHMGVNMIAFVLFLITDISL